MKPALTFLFSIFFLAHSWAQATGGKYAISGRIVDSATKEPLEYAAVSVFLTGKADVVNGMMTDNKGKFAIDGLDTGTYRIKVDYMGYRTKIVAGVQVTKAGKDLGDISITDNAHTMKEVTITRAKSFVENKIDKFVFNVGNDVTSAGGTATDVLQKVPQVSVDINGNVELLGNANIKVLLNGKPSPQFDNNLADALKTIPAAQIEKIEVITSPGAQYDAEGTGGIINIVLKESTVRGINGTVSVSAGTRQSGGSVYVHAQKDKIQYNLSLSGTYSIPSPTSTGMDRTSDSAGTAHTRLTQNGHGNSNWYVYRGQFGIDWDATKNDRLSTSVSYFFHSNQSDMNTNQLETYYTPTNIELGQIRNAHTDEGFGGLDWTLSYKKTFKKEGQELSVNIHPSLYMSTNHFNQNQQYAAQGPEFAGMRGYNKLNELEGYINIDYAHPFTKDIVLNTGVKSTAMRVFSDAEHYNLQPTTGDYMLDQQFINHYNFFRDIHSAYVSLSMPIHKDYSIKIGLRDEVTVFHPTLTADSTIPNYNTICPSAVISRKIGKNQNLKLSYAYRIQRPGWWAMNPFIDASDPLNIQQGNPALVPEKVQNIDFSYFHSFEGGSSLMAMLYYRYSTEDEQTYVIFQPSMQIGDSVYRNVSVTTNVNAGTQYVTGLNLSGTIKAFNEKLEARVNVTTFDKYIVSQLVAGATANTLNYRINLNISCKFTPTLVAECFGNFRSASTEIQGKFPSFSSYSMAIRKLFWNKNGSLAFTTTNPFTPFVRYNTNIAGTDFTLTNYRSVLYQSFGLSFSYKFGKLEFKNENEMGGGEEM